MPTVTDFTKAFGVTATTVRRWSADFGDHLSAGANPPKGETRRYSDHDGRVLALVAAMRSDGASYEGIHAALDAGELGDWPPERPQRSGPGEETGAGADSAIVSRLTATVARFEGQLEAVTEERDHLRGQVDELQAARLAALERATRAETELAIVKGQDDREGQQGEIRRPWWQFWK